MAKREIKMIMQNELIKLLINVKCIQLIYNATTKSQLNVNWSIVENK